MALVKHRQESKLISALNTGKSIIQYARSEQGKKNIKKGIRVAKAIGSFISQGWEHMRNHFGGQPVNKGGSSVVSAPVREGMNQSGFRWAFGKAPDVGVGPGLRLFVRCRGPTLVTSANVSTTDSGFEDITNSVYRSLLMLDPSVANVQGATIVYPAMFQKVSGVYNMVKNFERYLIRHLTVELAPVKSTATDGSIALGRYNDPVRADVQYSAVAQTNYDKATGLLLSQATPVWEPTRFQALHIPDTANISPADLFWVHTDDTTAVGQDAGRLVVQGALNVGYSATAISTATHATMLEVAIDLYCPATVTTNVAIDKKAESMSRLFHISPREVQLEAKVRRLEQKFDERESGSTANAPDGKESKDKDLLGSNAREEQPPLGGKAVLVRSVDNTHTPPNTPVLSDTRTAQSVVPRSLTRSSIW